MNFIEFTKAVSDYIREKGSYETSVREVEKNNGIKLMGLVLSEGNQTVQPVIYLEEYYRRYQEDEGVEELAEEIIATHETCDVDLDMTFFRDYAQVEDRIYIRLVNYGKNKELLKKIPHIRWLDLAAVFYYAMKWQEEADASILLYHSHLAMWGKTEEEICRSAKRNMERDMPGCLMPMREMLMEMMGIGIPEEGAELYVLTNQEKRNGAAVALYSGEIKKLADRLQSDLLILPSSIHELLLLKDDHIWEYKAYAGIVKQVNETVLEPQEFLSDSLYRYNRKTDEIEMAAA